MRTLSLLPSAPYYPTASELRIASECVAPWALGLPEVRETNEWAEQGKRCHVGAEMLAHGQGIIEALARALPEPPHKQTDAIVAAVEAMAPILERDVLECKQGADGVWFVEQGIKWRTDGFDDEAEFCERAPGERLRGWFSGTADLVYVRHDNLLVVVDWKFGPREHVTGEPARESCQGFFLALAFATLLEIRGSSAGVVVARFERRMVSEDGIKVDATDITQGELDDFADELRGLAKRIDNAVGAMPRISAACGKCKAKAECPAWESLDSAVVFESTGLAYENYDVPATTEDVRIFHFAIDALERAAETFKRLRDAYILTHPEGVEIGLGLKLKVIPSKDREVVNTSEGFDVIEKIVPGGVVFERKAGIGTIEKAVAAAVDKANITSASDRKKTKKGELERVFAELIAAGAVIDKGKKLTVRVVRSDEKEW